MDSKDINVVVGAGLSGAVIANILATKFNEDVLVVDKRGHVAGNVYDYLEDGIYVSKYGVQAFHTDDVTVWEYVQQFVDFNIYMHKRVAFVDGAEVTIPFNLNTIHSIFPETLAQKLEKRLLTYFKYNQIVSIVDLQQTEDETLNFLAQYIYEKDSLSDFSKRAKAECGNIDGVCYTRVPILRISVDNYFFKDMYQGMPHTGYSGMIKRMLSHPNIQVQVSTDYKQLLNTTTGRFKRTFYTGSIDEFFDYQLGVLPYQSRCFKFEKYYDREFYQSNAVIEYPYNYDFLAIHEFKHYYKDSTKYRKQHKFPKTIIAKEYKGSFSVSQSGECFGERSHPVVDDFSRNLYDKYVELSKTQNDVYFLGRLGDFQPYSLDKIVSRAIDVADKLGLRNESSVAA